MVLVDNTSLGLFWTSVVHLPAHLTSARRCCLPASQTRLFGCLFLTCSVEGTRVGYDDRSTVRGTAWYSLATRGLVKGGGVGGGVGRMVHCNSYSDS